MGGAGSSTDRPALENKSITKLIAPLVKEGATLLSYSLRLSETWIQHVRGSVDIRICGNRQLARDSQILLDPTKMSGRRAENQYTRTYSGRRSMIEELC